MANSASNLGRAANRANERMDAPQTGLWDLKTAANYLAMSEAFMRKHVRLGTIPFVKVGAKSIRFRRESLDAWLVMHQSATE